MNYTALAEIFLDPTCPPEQDNPLCSLSPQSELNRQVKTPRTTKLRMASICAINFDHSASDRIESLSSSVMLACFSIAALAQRASLSHFWLRKFIMTGMM